MATHVHLPVIPVNPQEKHAQAIVDYAVEANVLQHVRMNRWLALDIGSFRVARFNWVVFTFASAVLWAFVIGVMASEQKDAEGAKFNGALKVFAIWQKWITQNFTWLYIGTQVCVVFLALCARQHRLCGVHHPDLAKNATLPKFFLHNSHQPLHTHIYVVNHLTYVSLLRTHGEFSSSTWRFPVSAT